jgi:restriction endonuclease S subunit
MWQIGAEDIRNCPIPVPPIEVQRQIAEKVQERRAEIVASKRDVDRLRASVEQEIQSLLGV